MRPAVLRWLSGVLVLGVLPSCGQTAPGADAARASAPAAAPALARCAERLDRDSERALGPLPRSLGAFCLDAYSRVRSFGAGAPQPLERGCEQVLALGCGDGHAEGLEHLAAFRYTDAGGGSSALEISAAHFGTADAAYAFFTERLLGDGDPAELDAQRIDAPGLTVRSGRSASGWLGRYVVTLSLVDAAAPSGELDRSAAASLPGLARRLMLALPPEPALPVAVQKLPTEHRLPLGTRLVLGDVLGVPGMGAGAIGHYRDGDKRWRVLAVVRADSDSAHDVFGTLARSPSARPLLSAPLGALAFTERRLSTEPNVTWVVGQRHEVIYGVGDEAAALPELMSAEREAAVKLASSEKLALLEKISQLTKKDEK
jgi:uncharacterized protein DUF6599